MQGSMEVDNSDEYFTSYENLEIHEIMLKDKPRNEAYRKAIFQHKSAFEVRIMRFVENKFIAGVSNC